MANVMFKGISALTAAAVLLLGIQALLIVHYARKVSYDLQPFQKQNPKEDFKVLFAGDSTCMGTGTDNNALSTAGWFSEDFPHATVENYSRNGMRLKGLIEVLTGLQQAGKHYDLAVFQIGANDIINFTPLRTVDKNEQEVLRLGKEIAGRIIILHSGDIGEAPLFIWPFKWLLSWRSLKVRDIYLKNQDKRVAYVDIYQLEKNVPDLRSTYAPDNLHLNGKGYETWYSFIKTQM